MSDSTLIDRARLDQFKKELLALCTRRGFILARFRASEDHGIDIPEIDIELRQIALPPEPFAISMGLTSVTAPNEAALKVVQP